MTDESWLELLGWTNDQLDDIRNTGFAYIRQGKYKIALPLFEALVIFNPEAAYDTQTLGALYLELNRVEEALEYLDRALKLDADHAPTLLNFTKALFMLGRRDEAVKLADILQDDENKKVRDMARAMLLAYS